MPNDTAAVLDAPPDATSVPARSAPARRGALKPSNKGARRASRRRRRLRIQFDVSEEMFGQLEKLAEETAEGSVNEFARKGVRLYQWYLDTKARGYQFMIEKDGKAATIDVLL